MIRYIVTAALLFAALSARAVTYQEVVSSADGHWLFQDDTSSTTVVAESGPDLTIVGGTAQAISTTGPGQGIAKGFAFRGYSYYINGTFSPGVTESAATHCVWLRRIGEQAHYTPITRWGSQLGTFLLRDAHLRYSWDNDAQQRGFQGPTINDGEWTHCALRITSDRAEFFVNGVLGATKVYTQAPRTLPYATFAVGRNTSVLERWFNGDIADLQVYHKALTDDEIAAVAAGPGSPSVEVGDAMVREITAAERAEYGEATDFLAPGYKRFLWPVGAVYNAATKTISNDGAGGPRHITVGLEATSYGQTTYLMLEIAGDARGQVSLNDPGTFYDGNQAGGIPNEVEVRFFPREAEFTNNNHTWTPEEECARSAYGTIRFHGIRIGDTHPLWQESIDQETLYELAEACDCRGVPVPFTGLDIPTGMSMESIIRINCYQQNCDEDGIDDRQDGDLSECDILDCDCDGIPDELEDDPCGTVAPWPGVPAGENPTNEDGSAGETAGCPTLHDPTDPAINNALESDVRYRIEQDGCWDVDADGVCDQCDADARQYYRQCSDGTCYTFNFQYSDQSGQDVNVAYFIDNDYCQPCADEDENGVCDDCQDDHVNNLSQLYDRFTMLISIVNFTSTQQFCPDWQISERISAPWNSGLTWYFDWNFRTCFDYRPETTMFRLIVRGALLWMLRLLVLFFSLRLLWAL